MIFVAFHSALSTLHTPCLSHTEEPRTGHSTPYVASTMPPHCGLMPTVQQPFQEDLTGESVESPIEV